jgi:hypothetical protein
MGVLYNKKDISKIIGIKFGKLTLIKEVNSSFKPSGQRKRMVLCKCDCGNENVIQLYSITSGNTKSCGCYISEQSSLRNKKHGESDKTKEYRTWQSIKRRCYNINNEKYKNYGGRGIKICDRWLHSFENFLEDIGRSPSIKHSIDRIDVNGNYEPNNCRWATQKEQCNNRSNNHYITYNSYTRTIAEWSEIYNISQFTLLARVNKNKWTFEQCINYRKYSKKRSNETNK